MREPYEDFARGPLIWARRHGEGAMCTDEPYSRLEVDHEVLVLNSPLEAKSWIHDPRIAIHCLERPDCQRRYLLMLYRYLRDKRPDLLMSYNWGGTDAIWVGRLAGVKRIIHNEHGFNIDEINSVSFKRKLMRFLVYQMCSRIVVVSHGLIKLLKDHYFVRDERIHFIANGIDTDIYVPHAGERAWVREELGIGRDDFIIGFTGRLDPIKNFGLMLDIFEKCIGMDQRCKLMIVGDGPEKRYLQEQCREREP